MDVDSNDVVSTPLDFEYDNTKQTGGGVTQPTAVATPSPSEKTASRDVEPRTVQSPVTPTATPRMEGATDIEQGKPLKPAQVEEEVQEPCECSYRYLAPIFLCHLYGALATAVKTFAWWFNQWPYVADWDFYQKWLVSASFAGCEYLPLTKAMQTASSNNNHLGFMTAFMEATDNFLRMMQQLALGDPLAWYDWVAAAGLAVCVIFQGYMHFRVDSTKPHHHRPPAEESKGLLSDRRAFFTFWGLLGPSLGAGLVLTAVYGGYTGQAYVLATIATGAKTFAWWINQYPMLKNFTFLQKWLAGWSIAAIIEYLPLIGAMQIAQHNNVHLGLMTAYMEALDNFFRVCQQKLLRKPLDWFDYAAAAGMFVCVIFQGVLHYELGSDDRHY
jgi:hypothetical protein